MVSWASFITLVALVLMLVANYAGLVQSRVVAFGIPAAFIVYGLCCLELQRAPRKIIYMNVLGDASYSLYLTHVFTLVLCRLIFQRLYQTHSLIMEITFIALCLTLSLTIAVLTYYLYEKPASEWLIKIKARWTAPVDMQS